MTGVARSSKDITCGRRRFRKSFSRGPAGEAISITARTVHVWRVDLGAVDAGSSAAEAQLDPDERAQARRFATETLRRRYVAAHVAGRRVLGSYLGVAPEVIPIVRSACTACGAAHGKPKLALRGSDLRFNLSHSDALAVIAVGRGRDVGVDVERVRADVPLDDIARAWLEPDELARLERVVAAERPRALYARWTRKEAYLKGRGDGLNISPREVALDEVDNPRCIVRAPGDAAAYRRWRVHDLELGELYVGAVAVEGTDVDVELRDWPAGPPPDVNASLGLSWSSQPAAS